MAIVFMDIVEICKTEECPNFGLTVRLSAQLDAHGCLPWWVCGVCRMDLIPNPHPVEEVIE